MDKFIYVFNKEARDRLINQNLVLLKSDERNSIFVFETPKNFSVDFSEISFIFSNTLTF